MKKIIIFIIFLLGCYLLYGHLKFINGSKTQIDQIEIGINQLLPLFKNETKISFMANSPEELKIHFESQYILAPTILEKGFHDNKNLLYIEDFNYPTNEYLPTESLKEIRRYSDDRFHFILFEKKQ